jgi:hypothetical protein
MKDAATVDGGKRARADDHQRGDAATGVDLFPLSHASSRREYQG